MSSTTISSSTTGLLHTSTALAAAQLVLWRGCRAALSSTFRQSWFTERHQSLALSAMTWIQREVRLSAVKRGCHLVTKQIESEIASDLRQFKVGLCHIFIQHTSASLTINENADPDVRVDMETFLNKVVPEGRGAPWIHTDEGPDDMPAHCKSSMFGASLTIPITKGRLNMGTWQGIWLCEHRDHGGSRRVVVTMQGETQSA